MQVYVRMHAYNYQSHLPLTVVNTVVFLLQWPEDLLCSKYNQYQKIVYGT